MKMKKHEQKMSFTPESVERIQPLSVANVKLVVTPKTPIRLDVPAQGIVVALPDKKNFSKKELNKYLRSKR